MRLTIIISMILLACGLSGCAIFAPERRPLDAGLDLPEHYATEQQDGAEAIAPDWWTGFGDTQLNTLVATALSGNLDLVQADARLRQAAALSRQQSAGRYPDLDLEGSGSRSEMHTDNADTQTDSYSLGLAASYELDLWGRVRSAQKAAVLSAQAGVWDRDTVAMTVSAQVVQTYFQWLAQCAKVELLNTQAKVVAQQLELIELRFARSQSSGLDVLEQREALAAAESALLPQQSLRDSYQDQLAVLTGRAPGSLMLTPRTLPSLPPMPSAGLPSGLLQLRPDVQAAWLRLRSAEWAVSEARANRLPTLRLSASAGYSADELDVLFDQWVSNLAASLVGPLIDGGSRRAAVDYQKALTDERMGAYRAAVLSAVLDVQDALRNEQMQQALFAAVQEQVEMTAQAYRVSLRRYNNGQETYLRVLQADYRRRSLETEAISSQLQLLLDRVALCRAAGGPPERMMLNEGESM